jgi:hypothetical protein
LPLGVIRSGGQRAVAGKMLSTFTQASLLGSKVSPSPQQCGVGFIAKRDGGQQVSAESVVPVQHCPAKSWDVAARRPLHA